jgi:hypothetical protein
VSTFLIGEPTYPLRRGDGRVVRCTIPVDWPASVRAGDERFFFEAAGCRADDGAPAGRYASAAGDRLWYCGGQVILVDPPVP